MIILHHIGGGCFVSLVSEANGCVHSYIHMLFVL